MVRLRFRRGSDRSVGVRSVVAGNAARSIIAQAPPASRRVAFRRRVVQRFKSGYRKPCRSEEHRWAPSFSVVPIGQVDRFGSVFGTNFSSGPGVPRRVHGHPAFRSGMYRSPDRFTVFRRFGGIGGVQPVCSRRVNGVYRSVHRWWR